MSRFFITGLDVEAGGTFVMDGENARHALRVLRHSKGDEVTVCGGDMLDHLCVVRMIRTDSLVLEVIARAVCKSEPKTRVHLFTSLLKLDKTDMVIQKSVELGAVSVRLFQSENSVAKIKSDAKGLRRAKIALAAAMQCGRGIVPPVGAPVDFVQALKQACDLEPSIILAAHEKSTTPLKQALSGKSIASAAVFTGPEGGFAPHEIADFEDAGAVIVSLGKRILRAETAAVAFLANMFYELEE